MRALLTTFVVALVTSLIPFEVAAQVQAPMACQQSLACQQQRVADLLDYRAFLEDQLALAKSLVRDLQAQMRAMDEQLKACVAESKK